MANWLVRADYLDTASVDEHELSTWTAFPPGVDTILLKMSLSQACTPAISTPSDGEANALQTRHDRSAQA
jgi:hypothetical protein